MIHAKPKKKPVAPVPKKIGRKQKGKKPIPEVIKYVLKIQNGDWVATPKWKPLRTTISEEYTEALERFKELQQDTRLHSEAESSLGWYWKRLLPAIPLVFSRKHQKIEIRASQVAESVMLFVLKDDTLFLPPMFCSISRLAREDQQEIYRELFHDDIKNEYRNILDRKLNQDIEKKELQYVLGRHDLCYEITDDKNNVGIKLLKATGAVEISLKPKIKMHPFKKDFKYKINKGKKDKNIVLTYPWHTVELPPPHFEKVKERKKPKKILLSSKCVRQAFEKVSEIWNDPTVKSVLLIAPPGSGKEILADAIYRGKLRKGDFESISLASESIDSIAHSLYGTVSPEEVKKDSKKASKLGFIGKTTNGVIFLDEVDKATDEVRSLLLRLLEQDSYVIPGTNTKVELNSKTKNLTPPLYIFAGSLPTGNMFTLKPYDFWTRISHVIQMQHPLDSDDFETKKAVCKDYFSFFWLEHIPKLFKASKMIPDKNFVHKTINTIHNYYSEAFGLLISSRAVETLSEIFAQELGMDSGPPPSIRNIRSIAKRVAYELVELVLYDKKPSYSWQSLVDKESDRDVFTQLKELFPNHNSADDELNIDQAKFEKTISRIISSSIRGVI